MFATMGHNSVLATATIKQPLIATVLNSSFANLEISFVFVIVCSLLYYYT
jgi:hypothetical protein